MICRDNKIHATSKTLAGRERKERGKGSLRNTHASEIASLCPPTCLASSPSIRSRNWEKLLPLSPPPSWMEKTNNPLKILLHDTRGKKSSHVRR